MLGVGSITGDLDNWRLVDKAFDVRKTRDVKDDGNFVVLGVENLEDDLVVRRLFVVTSDVKNVDNSNFVDGNA